MTHIATDLSTEAKPGVSPATRKVMQANRRRDTGPELKVRRYLHARGYRFRVDYGRLPGRPDIALPKHRLVIFVHGCYWHRHGCGRGGQPRTNAAFWQAKFDRNADRHERNAAALRQLGWTVVVIWECSLRDVEAAMVTVLAVLEAR